MVQGEFTGMSIEQKINYQLNKFPGVKKFVKRAYQRTMYAISPKIKSKGDIIRVSPDDGKEYFFGYYDKSPWDIADRYILCLRANDTWSDVSPHEKADILLIDTEKTESDPNRVRKIAETSAWNVQQSCMLQWLGPDYSSRLIYNDYREDKYVSVILTLATMEEKVIPAAVYSVSADGKFALTLDFSRLYNLRPGYGYYNVPEKTKDAALPNTTAIWKVDLKTGEVSELLKYTDFANFQPRPEMQEAGAVHKVNHIMLNPNGKRFMVLYRWFNGQRKYTRLITCNVDGTDMYVLSDDDMVSHCFWKNNSAILAFENKKKSGPGYYLMKDKTDKYIHCWPQFSKDGHPSYSPDGKRIVTDSYPDKARVAGINLMDGDEKKKTHITIARVFAPFKYDNDTRCDLHPRWNHRGDKICFDSVFEGHRGMYVVDVSGFLPQDLSDSDESVTTEIDGAAPKYSIVTPMYNSFHLMKRYFVSLEQQTMKNFEVILVDDCSTDGSYEKACSYAAKTTLNLRVLRTGGNAGPGNARNMGMDAAMGEWLTFVDSDDWVDVCLLEKVDAVNTENDVNCLIYDYYLSDGKKHKASRSIYDGKKGDIPITKCMVSVRNHTFGKFYKLAKCREKNIRFPNLKRCEDIAFVMRALEACGNIYYMNEPLYYYYQRKSSLSNDKTLDESSVIEAFAILEDCLGPLYKEELREKSVPDLLYGALLVMCKRGASRKGIIDFIGAYEEKYPEWEKAEIRKHLGKAKNLFLKMTECRNIAGMRLLAKAHSFLL